MGLSREIYQLAIVGIAIWIILNVTVQNYRVSGISMDPNLQSGDYLIVDKLNYMYLDGDVIEKILPFKRSHQVLRQSFYMKHPQRGYLVFFQYRLDAYEFLVKRVLGLPNETITIDSNSIYINGYELIEPYITDVEYSFEHQYVMGDNEYFVLGDNRENSNDSRHWGGVQRGDILGKVLYKYWPLK